MKDVVIIGAGTAGLTAAIYTERAGRSALLIEENSYGGQIVNSPDIENYPGLMHVSGYDYAEKLFSQAEELGAEIVYEKAIGIEERDGKKIVRTDENEYECGAVIIATGAKNRHLGLKREDELTGSGVSFCATCDGMFFKGKNVAVAGGGNTAVEDAEYLANICASVYLIHRRDQFRADERDVNRLRARDNVHFVLNSNVTGLVGENKLEAVEVTDKNTQEKKEIPVSALFIAVGQVPDNKDFEDAAVLDQAGYVIAGEDCATSSPGIFTAGDCRTKKVRQLTTAASDGAVAALAACDYLSHIE